MESFRFQYFFIFLIAALCLSLLPASAQAFRRRGGRPPNLYAQQQQQQSVEDDGDIQQVLDNEEDFLNIISQAYTKSPPEAVTPKGTFIGAKETVNGKEVYSFKGIPYAKPPVDGLRFRRPVAADKLEEPFEATTLPNACPQTVASAFPDFKGETMWNANTNMSEDCLYLNIWVPAAVFDEKSEKVPVMFWIYGGGFFSGSSSLEIYDGAVLAATQDIVVVSAQYRLGPLGFLYLGIDEAPGNMGLIDQTLALQWTRDTIEYFSGNSNSITITGESCGSSAVGYHLVSPLSKSLIKRGVMMSGLPEDLYSFKTPEVAKSHAFALARDVGCKQKNPKEVVECLRKVDGDKLRTFQWKHYKKILDFPFMPTIDGYFLPDYPETLIKKGKAKRGELLIGSTQDEGTYFLLYHYLNYLSHVKPTHVSRDRFEDMMNELFQDWSEAQREAIIAEYTNWKNPEDGYANLHHLGEALGDALFVCKNRKFADNWANRGLPVYYYHLTERISFNPWAKWMGVMHADDVPILFGAALKSNDTWTPAEQQMSMNFMRMIGDYVKTGTPSHNWERYTSEHPVYLEVNATVITDASTPDKFGPKAQECAFWNNIIPLLKDNEDNCHNKFQINSGSRPQWNTMGEGVHGGQGFFINDMHNHTPRCLSQNKPSVPETSCQCSVEEGPTSETTEEVTPRPAYY